MTVDVFGTRWETPLFICPVGGQRAFHAEGEMATARAAKTRHHQMILSNVSTYSVEDVAKTLGTPPWQQLYMPLTWNETEKMVKRIEDAGCQTLVWTVDLLAGRNTPTMARFARQDTRNCTECHTGGPGVPIFRPMYDGLSGRYNPSDATWATFDRLKQATRMKVMLKGIDSAEDAEIAVQRGVDGIIVSCAGACRCSSTAACGTARTSTRRWPWARPASASDGLISGACRPSAKKVSSAFWKSCALNCV
jgi:isopentenyl diphosphate isomerase/L-lactate dehydrogenase-like FMN-dependent dehydrogenase